VGSFSKLCPPWLKPLVTPLLRRNIGPHITSSDRDEWGFQIDDGEKIDIYNSDDEICEHSRVTTNVTVLRYKLHSKKV